MTIIVRALLPIRIIDCRYCGRYQFQLDPSALDEELVCEFNQTGFAIGIREEEYLLNFCGNKTASDTLYLILRR